jgi:hypothetical protein
MEDGGKDPGHLSIRITYLLIDVFILDTLPMSHVTIVTFQNQGKFNVILHYIGFRFVQI